MHSSAAPDRQGNQGAQPRRGGAADVNLEQGQMARMETVVMSLEVTKRGRDGICVRAFCTPRGKAVLNGGR